MEKKFCFCSILLILLVFPVIVNAQVVSDEDSEIVVSKEEKYYKTITYNDLISISSTFGNNSKSQTIEISKEEYENYDASISPLSATVETTYKKLTTSISQVNSYYVYKAEVTWKNFPSKRSYDIIGIGFPSGVKVVSSPRYSTYYCIKGKECKTITAHYPQTFSNGIGTSFKLPEGDLNELKTTLWFDVEKDANLSYQSAAGDYSHATKTVTVAQSKKYYVDVAGINLQGVSSYFDAINPAVAYF